MKSGIFSAVKVLLLALIAGIFINSFESKVIASSPVASTLSESTENGFNLENNERRIFELINRERAKKGLDDLEWNSDLARLARKYSQQMAQENFFSHYDSRGASVVERAQEMKIKGWRKIGENLFVCQGTRDFTGFSIDKWMKSPGHRGNILDADYNTTGIGAAVSRDGKIYVTQVFTRR